MEAEDLVLDHSSEWEVIEEFCELFPDICVTILSQTLIVEAISIHRNKTRLIMMCLYGDLNIYAKCDNQKRASLI